MIVSGSGMSDRRRIAVPKADRRRPIGAWVEVELTYVVASGRTKIWAVYSMKGVYLGVVRWFGRWRQYTFAPAQDTVFNAKCLADIRDFLDHMNAEHGQEVRKRKQEGGA